MKKGLSDQQAAAAAVRWGVLEERTGLGLLVDGVFSRGDLDALYCDEDGDLTADTPKDARRLKTPGTLVFTYTPVEDPAVYEKVFKPFTDHLAQCTGKRIVYYPVQSNAAEIEAMRSGRLHFAGFSTGPKIGRAHV